MKIFSRFTPTPHALCLILLCLSYAAASLWTLKSFPPINADEQGNTVYGYNLLRGHGLRTDHFDDVFEPSLSRIAGAGTEMTRVLYNPVIGCWTLLFGKLAWGIRFLSTLINVVTLILLYFIGKRLGNETVGLMAAALAVSQPIFWLSGFLIRPECFLLAVTTLLVWLELRMDSSWEWKPLILGLVAGLVIGIHQNISVFFPALAAFRFFRAEPGRRAKNLLLLMLGFFVGAVFIVVWIDLKTLLLTPLAFELTFYKAPVLRFPWTPIEWFAATASSLIRGESFYFLSTDHSLWRWSHHITVASSLVTLGGGLWFLNRKKPVPQIALWPWWGALMASAFSLSILISRKEITYFIVLFPFFIPLLAHGLWNLSRRNRILGGLISMSFFLSLGMALIFFRQYGERTMPQPEIVKRLQTLCGPSETKVIGPGVLWFGWPSSQMRDIGALYFSYLYTGKMDLPRWLGTWKPEILIGDEEWSKVFLQGRPKPDRLSNLVQVPIDFLGTVDTGLAMGLLDVYRLHWEKKEK